MRVEAFMTKEVVTCEARDTVEDAARQMRDKGIGAVVVTRNGKLVGLVTDRQIALQAVAEGLDPARTPVSQVMTRDPACLSPDDTIFAAVDTMRSAGVVRRVPVVDDDNRVLGIVSLSDIAPIARDLIEAFLLEEERHSLKESRVLTGAKRIADRIRRPTKVRASARDQETRPRTPPTPQGVPARRGAAGRSPQAGARLPQGGSRPSQRKGRSSQVSGRASISPASYGGGTNAPRVRRTTRT